MIHLFYTYELFIIQTSYCDSTASTGRDFVLTWYRQRHRHSDIYIYNNNDNNNIYLFNVKYKQIAIKNKNFLQS